MGSKDEIESKPAHLILLTPYRFRLPRTEPIDFGEILRETSKYALTDKYYKTLDLATALRRDVYEILEYFALLPEAPPPVDNLVQLDETARRLYAAARPIMDAIDEYMPILCVLARLESGPPACTVLWRKRHQLCPRFVQKIIQDLHFVSIQVLDLKFSKKCCSVIFSQTGHASKQCPS